MAFTDRGGGMGASAFYGSSGNPNSQINVQAGPGYSFPGVGGFNLNGIAEKLWQDKEDARRRAQAQQDWENEMRIWQAKQQADAARPSTAQKQMEAMALIEKGAELEAKINPAPLVYTAPMGMAPFTTTNPESWNAFQKAAHLPASAAVQSPAMIPASGTPEARGSDRGLGSSTENSVLGGNNIGQTTGGQSDDNRVIEERDRKRREQLAFSFMSPEDQMAALRPYQALRSE